MNMIEKEKNKTNFTTKKKHGDSFSGIAISIQRPECGPLQQNSKGHHVSHPYFTDILEWLQSLNCRHIRYIKQTQNLSGISTESRWIMWLVWSQEIDQRGCLCLHRFCFRSPTVHCICAVHQISISLEIFNILGSPSILNTAIAVLLQCEQPGTQP